MSRKIPIPLRVFCVSLLVIYLWKIRGPAEIVPRTEVDVDKLSLVEWLQKDDVNLTKNKEWSSQSYTEYLTKAYEPPNEEHVNPHNFKLLLDEPMACMDVESATPKRVVLLVLISTVHANYGRRQAIRETWGSLEEIGGLPVVTLFLLARSKHLETSLHEESAVYHDLLMEDFDDTYKNLSLKTMMAMKWASTHCPQASFVMKTDDDMYVSYRNILNYIFKSEIPKTDLAVGMKIGGEAPIRNTNSKWYMSKELFPGDVYPPWLSGGGFVLSGDLPGRIYAVSLNTKLLHLEDVFVGVCLEKLKINLIMNRQFSNRRSTYSYCKFRNIITTHGVPYHDLKAIWTDQLVDKPCWFWT